MIAALFAIIALQWVFMTIQYSLTDRERKGYDLLVKELREDNKLLMDALLIKQGDRGIFQKPIERKKTEQWFTPTAVPNIDELNVVRDKLGRPLTK